MSMVRLQIKLLILATLLLTLPQVTLVASINETSPFQRANINIALGNPSNASDSDNDNFLIEKKQYVLSYNSSKGGPNWVSWHVDSSDIGKAPRKNRFHPEEDLPSDVYHVRPDDYNFRKTGYDQGHLCNSADRTATPEDNLATFSMANMLPQKSALNRGPWKKLEMYSRKIVDEGSELYIIAGGFGSLKRITKGKVNVPTDCWKIIIAIANGNRDISRIDRDARVIAVIMPNAKRVIHDPWQRYIRTILEIESATGYKFLTNIPADIRRVLKTRRDPGRAMPTR
jgi:endonuclease G, mitochondrial